LRCISVEPIKQVIHKRKAAEGMSKVLAQKSGLSEEEITKQVSQVLPGIVDKLTPNGRLPTAAELSQIL
jgi:uncharacterized protein YidB (DUF937 family)